MDKRADEITSEELAKMLLAAFGNYVGTPSEKLLEDGDYVINCLYKLTNHSGNNFVNVTNLPANVWNRAWKIFNEMVMEKQTN